MLFIIYAIEPYKEERKMQTWDKQPEETGRAYNAFLTYRAMGALRSLNKAAEMFYGKVAYFVRPSSKLRQFQDWSAKYKWVSRCSDFDIEEERLRIEQKRKDIREMDRRQAKDGMEMSKIGMYNIKLHATDDPPKDRNGNVINPKIPVPESTRLFTEGIKAERLARGEVTEISGHKGEIKTILEVRYEKGIKEIKEEDARD